MFSKNFNFICIFIIVIDFFLNVWKIGKGLILVDFFLFWVQLELFEELGMVQYLIFFVCVRGLGLYVDFKSGVNNIGFNINFIVYFQGKNFNCL